MSSKITVLILWVTNNMASKTKYSSYSYDLIHLLPLQGLCLTSSPSPASRCSVCSAIFNCLYFPDLPHRSSTLCFFVPPSLQLPTYIISSIKSYSFSLEVELAPPSAFIIPYVNSTNSLHVSGELAYSSASCTGLYPPWGPKLWLIYLW